MLWDNKTKEAPRRPIYSFLALRDMRRYYKRQDLLSKVHILERHPGFNTLGDA